MSIAQQTVYRDAYVPGFEQRVSTLRDTVITDVISKGGQDIYLVVSSGGRSVVTRGANGRIPAADDSEVQVPVNLAEEHDYQPKTGFDIFRAQGNVLQAMRDQGDAVLARAIDAKIIAALDTGTLTLGAASTFSETMVAKATTKLRNSYAGNQMTGMLYGAMTPAAFAYAQQITSFANSLYSNTGGKRQDGMPVAGTRVYWSGVWWIVQDNLLGFGTTAATMYVWHKTAVGHSIGNGSVEAVIDRMVEFDYSYARHTIYHGAAKLQNAGIIKITHDDSAYS